MTGAKEPLMHIVKRDGVSLGRAMLVRLVALVFALLVCAAIIFGLTGMNPLNVYAGIWDGAVGTNRRMWVTFRDAAILLCVGFAVLPAFRMRFWNVGAEGQVLVGAMASAAVMIYGKNLPSWAMYALCPVAGVAAGLIWGVIPAFFKAHWNTNETLFTLMLNYIALYLVSWLQEDPWRDPGANGFPKIASFDKSATLPKLFGVQIGWVIALVLVAVLFVYLKYTKQGYEISVVGESCATATYAGMNVPRIILRTMFLSGAIAGIAGMVQATGSDRTLTTGIAGGVGFTAIIVAWLAQLNPVNSLVIAFLFAVLEKGSSVIQSQFGLSTDCADVLQGIILFFVLGCEFFIRYKFVRDQKPAAAPQGGNT